MKNRFQHFSVKLTTWAGSAYAFTFAVLVIVVWQLIGPYFHYSSTWMSTITVFTDLVVFLMVFCIQNTQNRDSKAVQLKLNELIVADKKARAEFIGLEALTDEELAELDDEFKRLLNTLDVHPVMHKLHKKLNTEKERRKNPYGNLYQQAGHFVDTLFNAHGISRNEAQK